MLCKSCKRINVADLVEMAKKNYRNSTGGGDRDCDRAKKTEHLSWKHCESYEELVDAARAGCELCRVLLHALGEQLRNDEEGEATSRDALRKLEREGLFGGFTVTLDSEDRAFGGVMNPGMIPRDREVYLRDRFAMVEDSRHGSRNGKGNVLGESSMETTLNVMASASAVESSFEGEKSNSIPAKIKPPRQYITSYQDMIIDRLSFHIQMKNLDPARRVPGSLIFSLQVPRGQTQFLGPLQIGHYKLDPNLGSEYNFSIARNWITTCSEKHDECPSREDKPLPSRVINVGSDDQEPFLVFTNHGNGKFIALSHCWGGSVAKEAQLTTETVEDFKTRIPMAVLPANFVDAVLITRALGFKYLWIDCLCIKQDSREDWDVESKHMGDIYHDAIITLAAAAAFKATDGMLHTFSTYDFNGGPPIKLQLSKDSNPEQTIDLVPRDSTREDLSHLLRTGPLANRGWTLQEEILSPRTLYYGNQQIHWQCLHHYSSADGIHDYDVHWKRAFRYERIKDRIFNQKSNLDSGSSPVLKSVAQILIEYHDQMVVDYCTRSLTFPSDRYPAFSGIATLVHNELRTGGYPDTEYMAGIWSSHFREGLMWYFGDGAIPSISSSSMKAPVSLIPSWSWASVSGCLKNLYTKTLVDTPLDPVLVEHSVCLASANPYGAVTNAELVLDGYVLPMRSAEYEVEYPTSGCIFWDPVPDVDVDVVVGARFNGRGKRSDVWMVRRKGDSWLVIGGRGRGDGGLKNQHGAGNEKLETEEEEEKPTAELQETDLKGLPFKVLFIASPKRFAYGLVLKEVMAINTTPHENTPQHTSSSTGPAAKIPTYRRIGLIQLQIKVATKKWNMERFKWLDMSWKRQKLRLV